jgi:hypothetical protein
MSNVKLRECRALETITGYGMQAEQCRAACDVCPNRKPSEVEQELCRMVDALAKQANEEERLKCYNAELVMGRDDMIKELRECLQELIAIQNERLIETPFEYPHHTYDATFSGGECQKYGRYYGVCHSCDKDMEAHYATMRKKFEGDKETKLTMLEQKARALLAKGGV